MRLQGKIAVVTGGAQGIGRAICETFVREGATVYCADLHAPSGAGAENLTYLPLDVAKEESWTSVVKAVLEGSGRLDILVNNAGIVGYEPIHELALDSWNRHIAVNQTGVFLGMKHCVPEMIRAGGGSIVNISSLWGTVGVAGAASYQASKGAVRCMTKNAAITYATQNVRCNSIHPGWIDTPLTQGQDPALNAAVIAATPMKRGGKPQEIANAVLFLASDEASYVTGAELPVDGGSVAQ